MEKKLKGIKFKKNQMFIIDFKIHHFEYNSLKKKVKEGEGDRSSLG